MNQPTNALSLLMSVTHAVAVVMAVILGIWTVRQPRLKRLTIMVICLLAAPWPSLIGLLPISLDLTLVFMMIVVVEVVAGISLLFFAKRADRKHGREY